MGANTYSYAVVPGGFNENFYEQCVIEHMTDKLGYTHLYGPDVERTSDEYRDVFLPGILEDSLARINKGLPAAAIDEAILKIQNIEGGTLEQRNETFNDYLQSGVEVRFFDGKQEHDDIVRLLDFDDPNNNDFHVVNQWTFVEYSEKRPDVIAFVNGMPLVMFELKSPSREETDASDAYLQLRNYMHHIPSMFVPNVFCVMSDMSETRVGTMVSRKLREFTDEDIAKVADAFDAFRKGKLEEEKGFSAIASIEDIAKQDYIITPGRYVGIADVEEDDEPFEEKMARLTGEISKCFEESNRLQEQIKKNLEAIGYGL